MNKGILQRAISLVLAGFLSLGTLPLPAAAEGESAAVAAEQTEPTVTEKELEREYVGTDGKTHTGTVMEYTYTFSALPANAQDLASYKLDSPYKTVALLVLAYRTWTPEDPSVCLKMLDRLTDTGATLSGGDRKALFSEYTPWVSALKERMEQNDKYRFIGDAYLGGATPDNDYTPSEPYTVTLRESVFQPYAAATETAPELQQILISIAGAENDRYTLLFQDVESKEWKIYGANWQNLLADIQTAETDTLLPPEYEVPANPAHLQTEPQVSVRSIPAKAAGVDESGQAIIIDTTVEEYTFTFSTVPTCYEDIVQYKLDNPYKTLALLFLAYRTWDPEHPEICAEMLDYLTNTDTDSGQIDADGRRLSKKFSEDSSWVSFLKDRMTQNNKYRYIGNAYLKGAAPANDYEPDTPITVTLRQSTYDPYHAAYMGINGWVPELKQVLIHIDGADNDRYSILYQDQRGDWRIWSDNWKDLLADVQKPYCDILLPPEYTRPENPAHLQAEPEESVYEIPARAPGVDDFGNPVVIDTTVKQHTFTFSTVPTCYEDIVQYKLDSPYKTMALLIMAFRTWTPENKKDCLEMLNYLTNTAIDSGKTDASGRKLSKNLSDHQFWTGFIQDRMTQNNKYRYIGNAYLEGAMPANDYTPTDPYTVTVRESVYNPYRGSERGNEADPSLYQVLISLPGADNDRYSLFYQDQRGDWRVFGDNWMGLLVDVKTPGSEIPLPPEPVRSETPASPQTEPQEAVRETDAMAVGENDEPIPVTVEEHTFTFSTVPTCYEDIVQYKLDNPYKTMALLFLAFKTWTPDNPADCAEMLDYLTSTAVEKPGSVDNQGRKLSYAFSEYNPWVAFLSDRMQQNDKYRFIGNAYLKGASPANDYTPAEPITVTVRQSVYDPFKAKSDVSPELKQILVSIDGADNDRYSLFYQDQRGDWRVFGDNWMGLLADIRETENSTLGGIFTGDRLRTADGDAKQVLAAVYSEAGRLLRADTAPLTDAGLERLLELSTEGGAQVKLVYTDENLVPTATAQKKIP